jgi:hypothetical protein
MVLGMAVLGMAFGVVALLGWVVLGVGGWGMGDRIVWGIVAGCKSRLAGVWNLNVFDACLID